MNVSDLRKELEELEAKGLGEKEVKKLHPDASFRSTAKPLLDFKLVYSPLHEMLLIS